MKYSIIMPYHNRFLHLQNTLVSFKHWYKDRDDFEIIIVEDYKNQMDSVEHLNLLSLIDEYEDLCPIKHIKYSVKECYNPAGMFNLATISADGEYLILTNPECLHEVDILSGLNNLIKENNTRYIVCSCKSIYNQNQIKNLDDLTYTFDMWYVHGEHYPRKIHFCTCISRDVMCAIGGFDEEYMKGIAYEDDDFVKKIEDVKYPIHHADDLVVLHQAHSRYYGNPNQSELMKVNELYYKSKWKK